MQAFRMCSSTPCILLMGVQLIFQRRFTMTHTQLSKTGLQMKKTKVGRRLLPRRYIHIINLFTQTPQLYPHNYSLTIKYESFSHRVSFRRRFVAAHYITNGFQHCSTFYKRYLAVSAHFPIATRESLVRHVFVGEFAGLAVRPTRSPAHPPDCSQTAGNLPRTVCTDCASLPSECAESTIAVGSTCPTFAGQPET